MTGRILVAMVLSVAVLVGLLLKTPSARLIYNATASAPLGWYAVLPLTEPRVGDVVLAWLPKRAAMLADQRHYLPASVPILKRVGAMPGQRVCVQHEQITVDSDRPLRLLTHDGAGRLLPAWPGCRMLNADEVFLLSDDTPASFDSRYFGPIRKRLIIGRTVALWTW